MKEEIFKSKEEIQEEKETSIDMSGIEKMKNDFSEISLELESQSKAFLEFLNQKINENK